LLGLGAELESRDIDRQPLSETELDELIGAREYRLFLNPRNRLYRERNMARETPSRVEAIRLMSGSPNLIRRPLVRRGQQIVLGFDEAGYRKLLR